MLAVENKHHIKLQMYGSGLDLVQATLHREYPNMKFSYEAEDDSDEDYVDSEDSDIMKEIGKKMTPGDHLVIRRENKGWTQKELSEKTGIAIPNISLIEAGKRPIGARTAKKLAIALNCDISDFLV